MTFNAITAVQSLMDEVHRRAPEIESVRRLPADLAKAFADAGLFRMLLPASLGGHDTPPAQIALAVETLAQADASAAWCLMIGATTG
ncbi:MAG TPA: acyl-CoA dehydrogenase family protein, partial [Caulobacter sp.]|nr:acyl-CoA dehydrogenase family protein [Caulobacter sp.]